MNIFRKVLYKTFELIYFHFAITLVFEKGRGILDPTRVDYIRLPF